MSGNNNVVEIRERYEQHAPEYLKNEYEKSKVELLGHTRPGRMSKDIRIRASNGEEILIEVKGSQMIDINAGAPRWQRVLLKEQDYASTQMADKFLFIFDTGQLGFHYESCGICESFNCSMRYVFLDRDQVLAMVKDPTKKYTRIPILRILKEVN